MSAAPMGMPGWPLFACCTASADSMRMVSTAFSTRSLLALGTGLFLQENAGATSRSREGNQGDPRRAANCSIPGGADARTRQGAGPLRASRAPTCAASASEGGERLSEQQGERP